MSYKVLHISSSDSGGAGIAARRLNEALNENRVQSHLLCLQKYSRGKNITKLSIPLVPRVLSQFNIPIKQNKYRRIGNGPKDNYEALSFPESLFDISEHPLVKDADIINLHWVGGMLNYPAFFKKVKKPIVWTLHDMNPFLGMAHYQGDLLLNPHNSDLEAKINYLKIKAYNSHPSITIVNLCEWMKEYSSQSDAFKNRNHYIIPNSLDLNVYKLRDKTIVRKALEIPNDKPVIMFCCQNLANRRKGFELLLKALPLISTECNVITVGDTTNIKRSDNLNIIPFGKVNDQRLLAMLYSASDIFVLPSREDNLPNTMLESLSCGTPVISFSNGGMRDIITNYNGRIIQNQTSEDLASAIDDIITNLDNYSEIRISSKAHSLFNPSKQAQSYHSMYKSLL